MNPQPTQGDKKDTINPNVEPENVEPNVHDSAALPIDAQEYVERAYNLLVAEFQDLFPLFELGRETIRRLEELSVELMEMGNDLLQMESILEQNEADQAELDKESEETINMKTKPRHALDGNFNEVLLKESGQESNIIPITEPGHEFNNERHDEPIDEPQPNANNMIDNNVGGAETDNEVASDIKQDTQEQLKSINDVDNQQIAAEEKLLVQLI